MNIENLNKLIANVRDRERQCTEMSREVPPALSEAMLDAAAYYRGGAEAMEERRRRLAPEQPLIGRVIWPTSSN